MRRVVVGVLGLAIVGCGSAPASPQGTAESVEKYPPVPGNPAGIGTPPFHGNSRATGFKGRPDPFVEKF